MHLYLVEAREKNMSDSHTSRPAGVAPSAPGSVATRTPSQQEENSATAPHITCFACSRCEYPVCDSSDLLLRKVRQGASNYAFQYNLDGLLDLDDTAVPCYSAAEVVHTSVIVSEALMKVPLPPAAQVVALESIVQSRKFWVQQRRSMNARLHEHDVAPLSGTGNADTPTQQAASDASAPPETAPPASTTAAGPMVIRRYGDSSESRIDLVCVRDNVLGLGVQECTQDRSAAATTLVSSPDTTISTTASEEPHTQGGGGSGGGANTALRSPTTTAPTVVRDPSFAHVPPDVLKAATAAAVKTQWSSPGNMSLREAYMEVNRTTLSSRAPWFQDYRCVGRVQCPDCHQALGFIFRAAEGAATSASATAAAVSPNGDVPSPSKNMKRPATTHDRDGDGEESDEGGNDGGGAVLRSARHASREREENRGSVSSPVDGDSSNGTTEDRPAVTPAVATAAATAATTAVVADHHVEVDGTRLPHAKKTKNENDAQAAAAAATRRSFQEALQEQQQQQQRFGGRDMAGAQGSRPDGGTASTATEEDTTPQPGEEEGEATEAPPRFVGLELKHIVQRNWDLHAFQVRYGKSRELSTFRELFPEAEELQSLYSRLLGLRTQTELYNSLLRRHKEQNDVQMALLNSNKDRMHTYDEKIKTMQQIIEAQRAQIEMQTRQIRNQEELVQSHRRQFATQQRQMDVEQLLLSQQSKTIESQKEQLRLLKMHFQAVRPEVLEELSTTTSPLPLSAVQLEVAVADAEAERAMARGAAAAAAATPPPPRREESAEEDWTDTADEDEEKVRRHNGSGNVSATGEWESSGYRSMPPAHLCGVPTSFPASHTSRNGQTDEAPSKPSPRE